MGRKKHYKNPNKTDEEIKKDNKKKPAKKPTPKKVDVPKVEKEIEPPKEEIVEPVKEVEQPEIKEEKKKCKTSIKVCGVIMILSTALLLVAGLILAVYSSRSPEAVFKRTISRFFDETNKDAKLLEKYYFNIMEQPFIAEGEVTLSTDIEDFLGQENEIKDLKLKGKLGFDYEENKLQLEGSIKGTSETITAQAFIENRKTYLETSFFDKLLDITENEDLYWEFKEIKSFYGREAFLTDYNYKDYKYVSDAIRKAIIKSLDSEAMTSEKESYDVLGEEVKGRKYTYTIDSKTASKMVKSIATRLLDDKEFANRVSKLIDVDADDVKDALKEMKDEAKDIDFDEKVKINIYTRGFFNEFGGIEFVADKDEKVGIYTDGKNYEFRYVDGDDKLIFTAEKEDDEYSVNGRYNGESIFRGTVREFAPQKIDLDYKIIIDDEEEIKGTLYIEAGCEKGKATYEFKSKVEYDDGYDSEYIKVDGNYSITRVDELEEKTTKDAVKIEDVSEKDFMLKLKEVIDKDEQLKEIFGEALDEYIDGLDKYRDEDMHLINIANSAAQGLLTKKESVKVADLEDVDLLVAVLEHGRTVTNYRTKYQTDCFQIEDAEYHTDCIEPEIEPSQHGYDTGYTLDELVEMVAKRYGRKVDVKRLSPYGKYPNGILYYRPKRRDVRLAFFDDNYDGKEVFVSYLAGHYDVEIYKVVSITNEGNVYKVVYECTDDDSDVPFNYELTFEKLSEDDVRELTIDDVRIISLNLI